MVCGEPASLTVNTANLIHKACIRILLKGIHWAGVSFPIPRTSLLFPIPPRVSGEYPWQWQAGILKMRIRLCNRPVDAANSQQDGCAILASRSLCSDDSNFLIRQKNHKLNQGRGADPLRVWRHSKCAGSRLCLSIAGHGHAEDDLIVASRTVAAGASVKLTMYEKRGASTGRFVMITATIYLRTRTSSCLMGERCAMPD